MTALLARAEASQARRTLVGYVGKFSVRLRDTVPTQVDLAPGNGRGILLFHIDRVSGPMTLQPPWIRSSLCEVHERWRSGSSSETLATAIHQAGVSETADFVAMLDDRRGADRSPYCGPRFESYAAVPLVARVRRLWKLLFDRSAQHTCVERLAQITIHAGLKAPVAIPGHCVRCHGNNPQMATGGLFTRANLHGGLEPVHLRHLHVHQDEVKVAALRPRQSLCGRCRPRSLRVHACRAARQRRAD